VGGWLPDIERFRGVVPLGGLANAMLQQTKEMPVYRAAQKANKPVYVFTDPSMNLNLGGYGYADKKDTLPFGSPVIALGDPVEIFKQGDTPRQVAAHELGHFISLTNPEYPQIREQIMAAVRPQRPPFQELDLKTGKWKPGLWPDSERPQEHIADVLSGTPPRPDYYGYQVDPTLHQMLLELSKRFLR